MKAKKTAAKRMLCSSLLFYMGVIGNVIFAVAEVAVTPGAVPEFQIGIGYIRAAANCAAVSVGGLLRWGALLLAHRRMGRGIAGPFSPGEEGKQIQYILSGKQKIVEKSH